MSLITPKQVLHEIKVGYIAATGDTETITYGNIASKCNAAYGGGSGGNGTNPFANVFECIESKIPEEE